MVRHPRVVVATAILSGLFASASSLAAQGGGNSAPVAQEFEKLHFRSIGPATMSGRIADFAVYEANPAIYFVGSAHGGVWKTTSKGALFTPIGQDMGLLSIGDVTISQSNPDLLWVGTGESNNRQSTSWGEGVFKSTDGGKTLQYMGLRDSRHIGRILIDPANNDQVLVAAAGPLFGPGGDRGVYKTTDGGRTWKQVIKVDDETGANDLAMAYTDPRIIYAATYQRRRTTCCMNGGGPGSGVWKSTDGGDSFTRITGNGFPTGPLGRIAVDVYRKNANIVYVLAEGPGGGRGGFGGGAEETGAAGAAGRAGGPGGAAPQPPSTTGLYRSDDGGTNWRRVSTNNPRPMYFSQLRIDPNNPDRIYMGGVGLQMSIDGGQTFATDAALAIHDDIHAIWIDPGNSNHLLAGNDGGVYESWDMSKTWTFMPNLPVGLFYHVSYDMETPYNVCGGMQDNYNWCGPSASRHEAGIMNYDWFQIQGGDGFVSIPDLRDSRIVYTESQDGNIIRRNKITGESKNIRPNAGNVTAATRGENYRFHWDTPMIFSPNDPGTLLVGANRVFKSTDRGDSWTAISPDLTTNANRDTLVTMGLKGSDINIARNDGISQWPTIVALAESQRQPGVYYAGTDDGNVSASRDGGKTWQNITKNLPGFPKGFVFVSEVVPSRYDAGTVYVTVDNHRENDYNTYIWASTDFGASFRSLNSNLKGEVVKTLTEDQKNPDVLYIGTETGIFLSLDRGKSWRRFKANLPTVRVDEITLHPRDNSMLVATHGRSIWILDHLEPIQEYTAAMSASGDAKLFSVPTTLEWKPKDDRNDEFWGHNWFLGENPPADAVISYYLKKPATNLALKVSDASGKDVRRIAVPATRNQAGVNMVCWDLRVEPIPAPNAGRGTGGAGGAGGGGAGGAGGAGGRGGAPEANIPGVPTPLPTAGYLPSNPCASDQPQGGRGGGGGGFGAFGGGGNAGPHVVPGTYTVSLLVDEKTVDSKTMRVVGDPAVTMADAQRKRYNDAILDLHDAQRRGAETAEQLNMLYAQMTAANAKIKDATTVPAETKAEFATLSQQFDSVRVKFGVPLGAGVAAGRGGGGGGRGGAADNANVLARVGALKGQLMSFWEVPSDAMMRQSADGKAALQKAMSEASVFLNKATAMSQTLKKYDITLNVNSPMK